MDKNDDFDAALQRAELYGVNVPKVLRMIDKALDSGLFACSNESGVEKAAKLRKLIKLAVSQSEIDEAVSRHYEPIMETYR